MGFYLSSKNSPTYGSTLLNTHGLGTPDYLSKIELRNLFSLTVGQNATTYGYTGYGTTKYGSVQGNVVVGGRSIIGLQTSIRSNLYYLNLQLLNTDAFTAGTLYVRIAGYVYKIDRLFGTFDSSGTPPNEFPARVNYCNSVGLTYNPLSSLNGMTTPVVVWYE